MSNYISMNVIIAKLAGLQKSENYSGALALIENALNTYHEKDEYAKETDDWKLEVIFLYIKAVKIYESLGNKALAREYAQKIEAINPDLAILREYKKK